jgi:endonuclease-3
MDKKQLSKAIKALAKIYKVRAETGDPFEILVHGILSTRTKDTTTFPAQKRLLGKADSPYKMMHMKTSDIEKLIYPVGFYKTKSKLLKEACSVLIEKFHGKVPRNKKDLMSIPGVGNKVAALVLVWAFGLPYIPVDTHVNRIAQRLGAVKPKEKPEKTEEILETMLPKNLRLITNHILVQFGRDTCKPIAPKCYRCPIYSYCEYDKKGYYRNKLISK